MARISGVNIPSNKRIDAALPYIYGVGRTRSVAILKATKIDPAIRAKDLTDAQADAISAFIAKTYKIEGDLRRDVLSNIKRLKEIKCYRGMRHAKSLPCRGQRTKTNSRTVRGNKRRTMASGKKPKGQKT